MDKPCRRCGKIFQTSDSRRYHCSIECSYESLKISNRKGQRQRRPLRKIYYAKYRQNLRKEVFQHYSPELKCQCCGEFHFDFLTLDHIHGNGYEIRKVHRRDDILWVKQNNYPKDFQVLCMNCNFAKRNFDKQYCKVHHPELYI